MTPIEKLQFFIDRINNGYYVVHDGELYYKNGKLAGSHTIRGYRRLSSRIGDYRFESLVHRILFAYYYGIETIDGGKVINHIDGNKKNNHIENLEQVTIEENNQHAIEHGLNGFKGENHPRTHLTDEDVLAIKICVKQGMKSRKIKNKFGISKYVLYDLKHNRKWKHLEG